MTDFNNIECDGFKFDFTGAINVFKFDENDPSKPNYHGLTHTGMKAVDLIVEFPESYLFLEVKDFDEPELYEKEIFCNDCIFCEKCKGKNKPLNHLRNELKSKFRDTFIYRWAEDKLDKDIYFICLLTLENGLITQMKKEIYNQLPFKGPKSGRWKKNMVVGIQVVNLENWNQSEKLNKWPVTKILSPPTTGTTP